MDKLYVIQYDHVMTNTFTSGYSSASNDDGTRTYYFTESQKGDFIKKYLDLKDAWYCFNLRAYKADDIKGIDVDSLLNF